jgi:hypothetical protein
MTAKGTAQLSNCAEREDHQQTDEKDNTVGFNRRS